MKNTWLMVVVALLVFSAAACQKQNKAEQLAALDRAYQAGVLSEGEYNAKKLALMGAPPAAPVPQAPAAPVTQAPAANLAAPPANAPAAALAAPAADNAPAPAPPATAPAGTAPPKAASARPKPVPRKPAPVVTQSQAIPPERTAAVPGTAQPEPAAPPPVPAAPPTQPTLPAQPTQPTLPARVVTAPQSAGADEAEPQPLAGCVDTESKSGKAKGAVRRFYPVPLDSAITAARAALRSLDFIIQMDTGNDIEASKRRHLGAIVGAGGERLILHFEKSRQDGHEGTLATGETKKSFVGHVAQKSWTNAVLAQIACHLPARR